jgi:hypothetical protein
MRPVGILLALLILTGCDTGPETLTTTTLAVPDSTGYTCTVSSVYDDSSSSTHYDYSEPSITWGVDSAQPPCRYCGFCQFRLTDLAIDPDDVRGCTLNFYVTSQTDSAYEEMWVQHVEVDIPRTSPDSLYYDAYQHIPVAMETRRSLGWHHVAMTEDGINVLKAHMSGNGRLGLSFLIHGWGVPQMSTAAGHNDTLRPYLTIVHVQR